MAKIDSAKKTARAIFQDETYNDDYDSESDREDVTTQLKAKDDIIQDLRRKLSAKKFGEYYIGTIIFFMLSLARK